jgi:hypothetical protein
MSSRKRPSPSPPDPGAERALRILDEIHKTVRLETRPVVLSADYLETDPLKRPEPFYRLLQSLKRAASRSRERAPGMASLPTPGSGTLVRGRVGL